MGGIGSGNWYRWDKKTTIEETKRIDIRWLRKQGFLKAGTYRTLSWTCGDKPSGDIRFRVTENQIVLSFRFRRNGGEWEPVDQYIHLETTSCHYGGERKWFICPNCSRRVAILCGHDKYFLCRHCYRLPYGSQNEDTFGRVIRKRNKLRAKAFDETGYRKRKGIHYKTFERLKDQYWQLEFEVDSIVDAKLNGPFRINGKLVN